MQGADGECGGYCGFGSFCFWLGQLSGASFTIFVDGCSLNGAFGFLGKNAFYERKMLGGLGGALFL